MDDVSQIKARLPIEELVASYCTLQKKGRNFVTLCPFHNDTKPSFLVSPDKGIAYCFACQTGGDIFSFYQAIEGVDFQQAIRELAERAGVTLEQKAGSFGPKKDEKERARECLSAAVSFYKQQLKASAPTLEYLAKRSVSEEQMEKFEIGLAPDSFSATYEQLLKLGFSRKEILASGLGVQRELQEEKIYDRFRNRLMFPIHDAHGAIVGFGGRTMAQDDAKYINSSDGILYHKSQVLYALHYAKDTIRETKNVMLVEGYFDVLACHRAGATNAVATCGTALTPEHAKMLRRYADTATLCMDMDKAGQDAMERAFPLLAAEGFQVQAVVLPGKDPSETLVSDPALLAHLLKDTAKAYLDVVLDGIRALDLTQPHQRREAMHRMLRLINAIPSGVERMDYIERTGQVFGQSRDQVTEELKLVLSPVPLGKVTAPKKTAPKESEFSSIEIALGIFLFYPALKHLLDELITPETGMAAALFHALKELPPVQSKTIDVSLLSLPDEHRPRVAILSLFCEEHVFTEWSESMAIREIRHNCQAANKELLRQKQQDITRRLLEARTAGRKEEEAGLLSEYGQVLGLMKKAG